MSRIFRKWYFFFPLPIILHVCLATQQSDELRIKIGKRSVQNSHADRPLIINALPCLGPLAPRGAVGARHDGLPRQFSPLLPVVCHGLSLSEGFAAMPVHSAMLSLQIFSACPFFDCLRLFPVVLLWLCRPILSRAHTISVFIYYKYTIIDQCDRCHLYARQPSPTTV